MIVNFYIIFNFTTWSKSKLQVWLIPIPLMHKILTFKYICWTKCQWRVISISSPLHVWMHRNTVKKYLTVKIFNKKILFNKKKSLKLLTLAIYWQFLFSKEAVLAAVFMFELNLFHIFGPRNDILFCPLIVLQSGIFNAICDLVFWFFSEGINILFR